MQTIRIENGFGGTTNLMSMLNQFKTRQNNMAGAFATVKRKTNNASGGVGNMVAPLQSIEARIRREEKRREALDQVATGISDFLALTEKVDREVAKKLEQNSAAFYSKYPHLKAKDQSLIDNILAGFKKFGEWLDDLKKSIKKFWEKNKGKIIVTLIIVVCAALTIAGIIWASPAALVGLLSACGLAAYAATISMVVYVVALVSTALSMSLNVVDVWGEIDNPVFNTALKASERISMLTTLGLDAGDLFNAFFKFSTKELKLLAKMDPDDVKMVLQQHFQMRKFSKMIKGLSKKSFKYKKIVGNFGEMMSDKLMRLKGLIRTDKAMVTNLDSPLRQGIDGIYRSFDKIAGAYKYVVSEAKFNTATLNTCKNSVKQMSETWIKDRLLKAPNDIFDKETMEYLLNSALEMYTDEKMLKKFTEKLADGTRVIKYLDEAGKITDDAASVAKKYFIENWCYDSLLTNTLPDGTIKIGQLDSAAKVIDEVIDTTVNMFRTYVKFPTSLPRLPDRFFDWKELAG